MPELPEVEIVRQSLHKKIKKKEMIKNLDMKLNYWLEMI